MSTEGLSTASKVSRMLNRRSEILGLRHRNHYSRGPVSEMPPSSAQYPTKPYEVENLVSHGDDLAYLFPLKKYLGKVDMSSETFKAINRTCTLWTNFAKYGNPTPTLDENLGVEWKPYTLEKQEYLDLGNTLKMDSAPDKEEIELWESVFKQYLPKYSI
ncbi:unnamed protein product [Arctia plantaginis]|uniref:Carboxylesterase type B domain-containing protein n=1 Tax=Arctia plantaginis TaxID=874455 RepID=A0A8S1ADI8_ARCPL|nr:unnamed protein product [Arctia plantaginis]